MLRDFFVLAFRNLRHRRRRSWLTIIGTLIGILAVVSLVSIGNGLEQSIQSEFERLGGNKVIISGPTGIVARFTGSVVELDTDDLEAVRNARGVRKAAGEVSGSIRAEFSGEKAFITVTGIPVSDQGEVVKSFNGIQIIEGRYIRRTDSSQTIIDSETAENLFDRDLNLRNRLELKNTSFMVSGIYDSPNTPGMVLPIETARRLLGKKEGSFDTIIASAEKGFTTLEVKKSVERQLRQLRNVEKGDEDFTVRTAQDIIRSFQNQLAIVRAVLLGIGGISLLVGGVGIMNTMYTSVVQRTRQIGIMKAVGASRRQIMSIFLVESGIIGAIGGLIGSTIGLALSMVATGVISSTIGFEINAYVSLQLVAGSILFSFIVGTLSGIMPARKAAKLEPVEALRYE